MHEVEWERRLAAGLGGAFLQVEDRVLRVPPVDALVRPDERADDVVREIAAAFEALGPPALPVLVDVVVAALVRHGGREEHGRPERDEGVEKRVRGVFGDVLSDLEGEHEVEAAPEVERPAQVVRDEAVVRKEQPRLTNVLAVDAGHVLDPEREPRRRPRAGAAANVDDAAGLQPLVDERCDHIGGASCSGLLPGVVAGAVLLGQPLRVTVRGDSWTLAESWTKVQAK